jgi:hypothetical protein
MNNSIDAHLTAAAKLSTVKDSSTGRDKDLIFDRAADDVRVGSYKAVVSDPQIMFSTAAQNRVLEDDALCSERDGAAFSDNLGAEKNARAGPDGYVAANESIRCNVSRRRDCGLFAKMFDKHITFNVTKLSRS